MGMQYDAAAAAACAEGPPRAACPDVADTLLPVLLPPNAAAGL